MPITLIFLGFPPLLFFSVAWICKDSKHWKRLFWMYVFLFACLGFAYAPKPNSGDLVRYFSRFDIYKSYSLSDVLARFNYRETGETILIWLASKMSLPGLLPSIAAGTVYGVATYISCDYAQRNKQEQLVKWILFGQFLYLPFNSIVNNVFNVTAFALVLLAIYRDLIEKRRNLATVLLYVIPCFIQQGAFILIMIRLLAIPIKKFKYVAIAIVALLPGVINLLYSYRNLFSSSFLLGLIKRSNYYLNETTDTEYAIRVQTVLWHRLNFLLSMLFAAIVIWGVIYLWKAKKRTLIEEKSKENTFLSFLFLVAIFSISCVAFSAPHYWRFNLVAQMAIGFIFIKLINNNLRSQIWRYTFWIIGAGNFLIQFYRIMKSAVYIDQWMINFLTSTPYQIIYRLIKLVFS